MSEVDFKVIEATPDWSDRCRAFCQKLWQKEYYNPEQGITKDLLSEEVFEGAGLVEYFVKACTPTERSRMWLALDEKGTIIGTIAAKRGRDFSEIKTFYVETDLQGKGIGRRLYGIATQFCGKGPIMLDVVQYKLKSIEMYKRWGFEIDKSKPLVEYPWEGWPDSALKAYRGVVMVKPTSVD